MIEPNKEPDHDIDVPTASTGLMFTTFLLLISGLLLTSAMFLHYGLAETGETGETLSGLTRTWTMAKRTPSNAQSVPSEIPVAHTPSATTQKDAAAQSSGFSLKNLFSKNSTSPAHWPRLKLAGFGRPSEGEIGFAIINGKHIAEGGTISGVTLVEILGHGVVVEYKGETKTLIVEMTH